MKALLTLFLSVGLLVPAIACRCPDRPPVSEATKDAGAVFVGRAMRLTIAHRPFEGRENSYYEVVECEFSVGVALKGVTPSVKTISIVTRSEGSACGYPFKIGGEYLVYARKVQGEFETDV